MQACSKMLTLPRIQYVGTSHCIGSRKNNYALVSFTYNVGPGGARSVLRQVNAGRLQAAAETMRQYIHATERGPDGQPLRDENGNIITRVQPGLVNRRRA